MKKVYSNFSYLFAVLCLFAFAQVGTSQTQVTVSYSGGAFQGEDGWQLVDVTTGTELACYATATAGDYSVSVTVVDGNDFELVTFESFGDGWNSSNIQLSNDDFGFDYFNGEPTTSGNGSVACGAPVAGDVTWAGSIVPLTCELTAPADVTISTAPGTCDGGTVALALPTATADCVGIGACIEPYNSGQVPLVFTTTLQNTPFSITGVATVAVADVEITGVWNSDNSFFTEIPPLTLEGVFIDNLPFGGNDCAENDIVMTIPMAVYNTAAADGQLDFMVGADIDVNDFCASDYIDITVNVPTCIAVAVNDYNGTEDASGDYPLGTTVVIWTTLDVAGVAVFDTTLVTIEDLEGPTFLDCPGDFTVTLDPGDCNYTLNFDTTAVDNCPATAATYSSAFCDGCDDPTGGSALACSAGPNGIISEVILPIDGTIDAFTFNQESFGSAPTITVNVYVNDGSGVAYDDGAGTFTPVATATQALNGADDGGCVMVVFDPVVEVTSGSYWVEVVAPFGRAVNTPANCNGTAATGNDTYIVAPACAIATPTLFSGIGFVLDAGYALVVTGAGTEVVQDSDLGAGSTLPIGTTTIQYTATDGSGNTTVCSFNVVVEEYPIELQTSTLACNGGINFSVSEECVAVITPDMVLEGGPYGCYEDFIVQIDGLPAGALSGNGTNAVTIDASAIAGFVANGMYGPFEISIIDPDASNNYCWNGDFMLEDKLAPVFECDNDVTIACTTDSAPGVTVTGSVSVGNAAAAIPAGPDGGSLNFSDVYSVAAPTGAVVTGFSVDLDVSHTWVGDLTITLETPNGDFLLVDANCGSNNDILANFSDAGNPISCSATPPTINNNVQPVDAFASMMGASPVGDYRLSIFDAVNGDGGQVNSFSINVDYAVFAPSTPAIISAACSEETVSYTDVEVDGTCSDEFASVITRTWTAVDAKGNTAIPCVQTISVTRESLATLTLPVNWDGLPGNNPMIECSAAYPQDAEGHPAPSMTGSPGGVGACGTIIAYYSDVVLPICDQACDFDFSSYKVVRKWTILDWCTGEILEPIQIIKVMDTTDPVLADLPDLTVSTDIWGCGATIDLPAAAATDNCTAAGSITYSYSSTAGTQVGNSFVLEDPAKTMPGAPVVITVTATDCCDNSSTTSFEVTVVDLIPPVVVAETSRTVSLTTTGIAKAFAEDFDDGSHDGCGPIGFFVKRMDNGGSCAGLDKFPPAGDDNGQFNEIVHFCCADVGAPVMVQFRVCDDADMNGIIGSANDNCNIAMVEVNVQDKLAPQIICPAPMTISCIDLTGIDLTDMDLLDGLFGTAVAAGTCNVTVTQSAVGNENCGAGVIIRNFTATNDAGSSSCQQLITVEAADENTLTCERISFAGLNNNIYNWCAVNDNTNDPDDDLPAITINCNDGFTAPQVVIDINGLCTEAGISIEVDTFNFAGGACKKYLVHYEVIDQCIFDENYVDPATGEIDPYNSSNGYFEFFIEVDAFDNDAPVATCDDVTIVAEDCEGANPTITPSATDNCTDPAFFGYQWRLDMNNDNTIDFPASGWHASSNVTAAQAGFANFAIGTHRIFWIISDGCGNDATCSQLVTITGNEKQPTPYCHDGLSVAVMPSTGGVQLWALDFNAGSFDNCGGDLIFSMIPESDVDGLTADEAYDLSFDHANVIQLPDGSWGFQFDCSYIENGISAVIEVRMYVTDADGNWDYCTASLRLDDNFDACEDTAGTAEYTVSGKVQTELGDDITTPVTVSSTIPEFPMTETVTGTYAFDLVENVSYTITPERNDNHLLGITTLDIVMIQKHILGIATLESPYLLIAADVNNDCNVSGTDLVQLRKLILGKYPSDVLPSNTAWRFVEGDFNFSNPQAPCVYNETHEIFNLTANEASDFVGVKIGDVNMSAPANFAMAAETRSNENVEFVVVDNALTAGNTYTVDFLAKDFNRVYGFQYTMNLTGVEFVSVEAGALNVTENNFGLSNIANGELVVSMDLANGVTVADDAVLFSITVNALNNANLSDAMAMNSSKVSAEAYVGSDLEVLGSTVVFRTNEGDVANVTFALNQNKPNPFNGSTLIGFELPTTSVATLTVYNVDGKVLFTNRAEFAKGYNSVTINSSDLAAVGVLYYKLESGDFVATKKMIILE